MNMFLILGYTSKKVYSNVSKTAMYYFALVTGSAAPATPKANTNFIAFF